MLGVGEGRRHRDRQIVVCDRCFHPTNLKNLAGQRTIVDEFLTYPCLMDVWTPKGAETTGK